MFPYLEIELLIKHDIIYV